MYRSYGKRFFDLTFSLVVVVFSLPVTLLAVILSTIIHREFGLFFHLRLGLNGVPFYVIKIKTMRSNSTSSVTLEGQENISKFGAFIRKTKIDELPQFWTVITGKMSVVGPRPDVPEMFHLSEKKSFEILKVKPGITGPAQLKYRNEETLLANQKEPITYNLKVIWPDKVKINLKYNQNISFINDLKLIKETLF